MVYCPDFLQAQKNNHDNVFRSWAEEVRGKPREAVELNTAEIKREERGPKKDFGYTNFFQINCITPLL